MATKFVYGEEQRFACRDCPARCCRVPWKIQFSKEDAERYLGDEWVRERVGSAGVEVLRSRTLPFREVDNRLQCAFLDDDNLCSLQKRYGHDYLPASCQVFPYGFVRSEKGEVIVSLSRLCPSIQHNRGEPVGPQLKAKLRQAGKAETLAERLGTLNGVTLRPRHYLRVVRYWEQVLEVAPSPAQALVDLFDWTNRFEDALPERSDSITDSALNEALSEAGSAQSEPLKPRARSTLQARSLFAYQLGNLCYPSRVRVSHRVGDVSVGTRLRSALNKLAFFFEWGKVDMLLIDRPVKLQRVKRVQRFLEASEGTAVRDHLLVTLQRRHVLSERRYMMSILVELAMGTVLASRFARCRAISEQRHRVSSVDVGEGLGVADFLLLSHLVSHQQGALMTNLRRLLLTRRKDFRSLLACEL